MPVTEKCKLGFYKHDVNQDGRVCANDLFSIMKEIKEFDYFSIFDFIVLSTELGRKRPNSVKEKGYLLKELNAAFLKEWEAKQEELRKLDEKEMDQIKVNSFQDNKSGRRALSVGTSKSGNSKSRSRS